MTADGVARRDTRRTDPPRGIPRGAARALLAGSVLYAAWLLEGLLLPGALDPVTSYVSELSALDQPWSLLFRLSDAAAGACVLVGAVLVAVGLPRRGQRASHAPRAWLAPLGWWALAVFGAATMADAASPLACAPTQDQLCAAREAARDLPLRHQLHLVTSAVAGSALVVAVVSLTTQAVLVRAWERAAATLLACLCLAAFAWTLVESARSLHPLPWASLLGLAQRGQLLTASLWLAWCAGALVQGRLVARA